MAKIRAELEISTVLDTQSLAVRLEELARALAAGVVTIETDDHGVSLKPTENVLVELEVKQKPDKEKLVLSLTWRKDSLLVGRGARLKISSEPLD